MVDHFVWPELLDVWQHLVVLAIAYFLALPIGWNREREERSAGLRTFSLVAVSCCGFIQAAEMRLDGNPDAMAKVIEGLITGVGFIGGGAILKTGDSVRGTATAASLWATGAIGTAVGLGSYDVAVVISLLTVVSLVVLPRLEAQTAPERKDGSRAVTDGTGDQGEQD